MITSKRIALFQNIQSRHISEGGEYMEGFDGYVRISEYVDVTFPPRQAESIAEDALSQLDKAANEVKAKAQEALEKIADARSEYLMIGSAK